MSEARDNLVHLPVYADEPLLREHANCRWCSWHGHDGYGYVYDGGRYYDYCAHPILTGNGTGRAICDHERTNKSGKCKHYEPTRFTRLLRWTRLSRKAIMVPNE